MIHLDNWVKSTTLRVNKVLDQHDEAGAEMYPDDVEKYMELSVKSIVQAGIDLNLNCPLDAEAKVGRNWSQTH